jgi:hypothetical protein
MRMKKWKKFLVSIIPLAIIFLMSFGVSAFISWMSNA